MNKKAISRTLNVNYSTVQTWIRKEAQKAEKIMDKRIEKLKDGDIEEISFDKMWTYEKVRRGKKRKSVWIWTAVIKTKDGKLKYVFFCF